MKTKLDDTILFNMVFKCLCRVLKNRKIYHRFRCFMGHNIPSTDRPYGYCSREVAIYSSWNSMQKYVEFANNTDNPFFYTLSKDEMYEKILEILGNRGIITNSNCEDSGKVQMRIMQILNTIMHYCVERTLDNFSEIEGIGKEVFDTVCKGIYGDDFVDETEDQMSNDMKKMIKMQEDYLRGHRIDLSDTRIDSRIIQYIRDRLDSLRNEYEITDRNGMFEMYAPSIVGNNATTSFAENEMSLEDDEMSWEVV